MALFSQALTVTASSGPTPTFSDDFATLSLINTRNPNAGGTWLPAGGIGSSTDGYSQNGTSWILNPYNPATPINNVMTASNSMLNLQYIHTPSQYSSACGGMPYVGSRITTEQTFSQLYGYFECRAKLPFVQGTGFAFWLFAYGSPYQEIDCIEVPILNNGNYDAKASLWNTDQTLTDGIDNFTIDVTAWHTYGVDWQSDTVTFYIDRVSTGSFPAYAYTNPMFILLEMNDSTSWEAGTTVDGANVPCTSLVDYVKVWKAKPF